MNLEERILLEKINADQMIISRALTVLVGRGVNVSEFITEMTIKELRHVGRTDAEVERVWPSL